MGGAHGALQNSSTLSSSFSSLRWLYDLKGVLWGVVGSGMTGEEG